MYQDNFGFLLRSIGSLVFVVILNLFQNLFPQRKQGFYEMLKQVQHDSGIVDFIPTLF
jgi:hypothetical protein